MISFTDQLLIGNGQIDAEHKMLFDLIHGAYHQIEEEHCSISNAMELIHHLENYAETHFAHEEGYMKSIGDPEYPIQKREHEAFRSKVAEYEGIALSDPDHAEMVLDDLLTFLAQWLFRHILASDILIGKVPVISEEEIREVFAFTAKYHSGIPFVDEEHKWLFSLIQKSYDALHYDTYDSEIDRLDSVMDLLEELGDYTKKHFAHEEEYMLRIHFDGYDEQVKAHQSFIYKIEDVNAEIGHEDAHEYLDDLVDYLLFWLTNHILKMDLLIPYVDSAV